MKTNWLYEVGDKRIYPLAIVVFVCLLSLFVFIWAFPEQLIAFSSAVCSNKILCPLRDYYTDYEVLSGVRFENYAAAFASVRDMGLILFLLSLSIFSVAVNKIENFAVNNKKFASRKMLLLFWGFTLMLLAWALFVPNFYMSKNGEFNRMLPPGVGSFIFPMMIYSVAIGLPVARKFTQNYRRKRPPI